MLLKGLMSGRPHTEMASFSERVDVAIEILERCQIDPYKLT